MAKADPHIAASEARLRAQVAAFLHNCVEETVRPNPALLIPAFKEYALARLDHAVHALQPAQDDLARHRQLVEITAAIEQEILGPAGIWRRIIEEEFDAANLVHLGNSKDGYHQPGEFIRPQSAAIKRALRVRLLQLQSDRLAISVGIEIPPTNPRQRRYPKRAAWLTKRLSERGWSTGNPAKWHGPDRKTVKKIQDGHWVTNSVLDSLLSSLNSGKEGKPLADLAMRDIPDE